MTTGWLALKRDGSHAGDLAHSKPLLVFDTRALITSRAESWFFGHMHEFISPETLISRHVLYNRKPRNHEKHCPQKADHP
jgi:hypothetical protein